MDARKLSDLVLEVGPLAVCNALQAVRADLRPFYDDMAGVFPLDLLKADLREATKQILGRIPDLRNNSMVLAGYDLLVAECLAELHYRGKVHVLVSHSADPERLLRMKRNVPPNLAVSFWRLPNWPHDLSLTSAGIVSVGFDVGGGLLLVSDGTREALSYCRERCWADRTLISPVRFPVRWRPFSGWGTIHERGIATRVVTPHQTRRTDGIPSSTT